MPERGPCRRIEMARCVGPAGVGEHGKSTLDSPGTWEIPSFPFLEKLASWNCQNRKFRVPGSASGLGEKRKQARGVVPPSEGNEARREGRREVGASHSTCEAGEPGPRGPCCPENGEGRGRRVVGLLGGNMPSASELDIVSTRCQQIAELAKQSPQMGFTSLAHHIDVRWLHEAYV